jgi:hypothetical protein
LPIDRKSSVLKKETVNPLTYLFLSDMNGQIIRIKLVLL